VGRAERLNHQELTVTGARQVRVSDFGRFALSTCVAAAFLADCGGSQPPIAPDAMPQSAAMATHAEHGKSWMLPEAKSRDLLYVSNYGTSQVYVYSYPKGSLVGKLSGFDVVSGVCADGAGHVFVTNYVASGLSNILEFPHGGTSPIASLEDSGMAPQDCSSDSVTGNLAVTNYCKVVNGACGGNGDISIYRKAKGFPKVYGAFDLLSPYSCGYDNRGNLYVDGTGRHGAFKFAELLRGSSLLANIRLHGTPDHERIENPGGVRWDGKYVAVGESQIEFGRPLIYLTTGARGRIVDRMTLHRSHAVFHFWIEGKTLIAPNSTSKGGEVLFYKYPPASKPNKTIRGLSFPIGATVSLAGQ
jgi:hypothetical protein